MFPFLCIAAFGGGLDTALHKRALCRRITMKHSLVRKYKAWRLVRQRRRKLVQGLSTYSDRDLSELGFSLADFPAIIKGTYRR